MLISIVLKLQLDHNTSLRHHLGRASYAEALARLQTVDHALGKKIHDFDGPKPLTCSSILNAQADRDGTPIQANKPYFLRITGLNKTVSQALQAVFIENPPDRWNISGRDFEVMGTTCDPKIDAWSGTTTYEELAAMQLLSSERLPRRTSIIFGSPTAFKSKGMHVPVPMPNLFFGSLVERWNSFSPVTLSPEMRRFGDEMVAISNYRLQSIPVPQKKGTPLIGGMGRCTYIALGGDRYWLGTMQMLADFALYSGVGVKTTVGMGQCRRVVEKG